MPTEMEDLERRLDRRSGRQARAWLALQGLQPAEGWTANDTIMEACRRADCMKSIAGVPGFVDVTKAGRSLPEIIGHLREIAEEVEGTP